MWDSVCVYTSVADGAGGERGQGTHLGHMNLGVKAQPVASDVHIPKRLPQPCAEQRGQCPDVLKLGPGHERFEYGN